MLKLQASRDELTVAIIFLALAILLLPTAQARALELSRHALVIGNQGYSSAVGGPLANPHNDITRVGSALRAIGFSVAERKETRKKELLAAVRELGSTLAKSGPAAVGFVYYSGHGLALDRTNYLIPVDATDIQSVDGFKDEAVPLDQIAEEIKSRAPEAALFVVFDACREKLRLPFKSVSKGIVVEARERRGMFFAFATAEGQVASDVGAGAGPYAAALAEHLVRKGLSHNDVFQKVREDVIRATRNRQEPWTSGSMRTVYLSGQAPAAEALEEECRQVWEATLDVRDVETLKAHARHCNGTSYNPKFIDRILNLKPNEKISAQTPGRPSATGWWRWPWRVTSEEATKPPDPASAPSAPPMEEAPTPERVAWRVALHVDTGPAYRDFIERYPQSRWLAEAKAALEARERDGPVSPEKAEQAIVRSIEFLAKGRVDISKVHLSVQCKEPDYAAALRGFAQSLALYGLVQSVLAAEDLSGDVSSILAIGTGAPRDLLARVGLDGLAQLLSRLRRQVPPALLASSDVKAFASILLAYRARFDERVDEERLQKMMLGEEPSLALDDKASAIECFNASVEMTVGEDRNVVGTDGNAIADARPHVTFSYVPHDMFYGFWLRRRVEGSASLTASVLRRLVAG